MAFINPFDSSPGLADRPVSQLGLFGKLAKVGMSSYGGVMGYKLHLVINDNCV